MNQEELFQAVDAKTCTKCKRMLPLDCFYARASGGRLSWCKECMRTYQEDYRSTPEYKAKERDYRSTPEYKAKERDLRLRRKYNMTLIEYEAMLASQGGTCAACSATENLHIDHDHACCPGKTSCGKCVRWILCHGCNILLGHAHDDPTRLRRAADLLDGRAS